jgi:REP element-mobilizing transposase RayT
LLATINHYTGIGYQLHAFVIMPDHLHLLITPVESVEKSVQLIKGGFSFRAKRELDWNGEIWQPGFTDHRIRDEEDWQRHLEYIRTNPLEAKLVEDIALYEFMGYPDIAFPRGLKPAVIGNMDVRAEARTLQSAEGEGRSNIAFPRGLKPAVIGDMDVRAEARTLQPAPSIEPEPPTIFAPHAVKGTGFSPSVKPTRGSGALAPEGGKR